MPISPDGTGTNTTTANRVATNRVATNRVATTRVATTRVATTRVARTPVTTTPFIDTTPVTTSPRVATSAVKQQLAPFFTRLKKLPGFSQTEGSHGIPLRSKSGEIVGILASGTIIIIIDLSSLSLSRQGKAVGK